MQQVAALEQCLNQQVDLLNQLNALLLNQKAALAEGDYQQLDTLAEKQDTLSKHLETLNQDRIKILAFEQYNNPADALTAFLAHCTPEETKSIQALNAQLAENLVTCRAINGINGQVLAANIQSRQELINILSGHPITSSAAAVNLYTATGEYQNTTQSMGHQEA